MVIAVVAVLDIASGKRDTVLAEFKNVAKYVLDNEPDTLAYKASTNPQNADQIIVIERYKDAAAIKAHGTSAKFKAFGKWLTSEKLGKIASIARYEETDIGFTSRPNSKL